MNEREISEVEIVWHLLAAWKQEAARVLIGALVLTVAIKSMSVA